MRRVLEFVSLAALAAIFVVTALAFYGPARLPDRIPTHFNVAGQADAWGSPHILLLFPAIAAAIYLLMSWVARHPSAFNYPVRLTPRNYQRLEDLALAMIAWLKAEVVGFFACIQWSAIHAARHPGHGLSLLLMPALLASVFGTIIGYVAAMFRTGRAPSRR
jgi:uncharacterized membrane protein